MTNPIRLDLFPDLEAPEWTRLREIVGTIITVQDLPETLRRRLIPFVRTLAEAGVEHLNYRGEDAPEVWIDRQRMNIARYARNPPHILQVIETTAWWMQYRRLRNMCKPKVFTRNGHTTWTCMDCGEVVPHDKELCGNPQCESWDKLFFCTGDERLRPAAIHRTKSAS